MLHLYVSVLVLASALALTPEQLSHFYDVTIVTPGNGMHRMSSSGMPTHDTSMDGSCQPNPNSPSPQDKTWNVPEFPDNNQVLCLSMGPIGIGINGVALYNPFNVDGSNAVEGPTEECFDICNGHATNMGEYHYHQHPNCIYPGYGSRVTDQLVGVAFDGFPIYISTDDDGNVVDPTGLDDCNGMLNGNSEYEYWVTGTFPYLLGCNRGDVPGPTPIPGQNCYYACRSNPLGTGTTIPCTEVAITEQEENGQGNGRPKGKGDYNGQAKKPKKPKQYIKASEILEALKGKEKSRPRG